MSEKMGKKSQKIKADKLLLDFLTDNKLTLVVDEVDVLNVDVKDTVYVQLKRPRVRVFYLDDIKNLEKKEEKPEVDIIN